MAHKSNIVAMLLAGGQGSRLGVLTKNIAKPAVPYGGNYRIIDFPLSNCVNSGIYTVGVLTQYQPLELNDYIGNGQPWDLDRQNGGVHVLSPYEAIGSKEWYKGTANAIYQNINFIEKYNPEYVVVLSGDHIYKMNYAKWLIFMKRTMRTAQLPCLKFRGKRLQDSVFLLLMKTTKYMNLQRNRKSRNPTKLLWVYTYSAGTS